MASSACSASSESFIGPMVMDVYSEISNDYVINIRYSRGLCNTIILSV